MQHFFSVIKSLIFLSNNEFLILLFRLLVLHGINYKKSRKQKIEFTKQ